jgi:hypothetical protein
MTVTLYKQGWDLETDSHGIVRHEEQAVTVVANLMGRVLAVHGHRVQHFHSDMFRDMAWLTSKVERKLRQGTHNPQVDWEIVVWWACDDMGTAISEDLEHVKGQRADYTLVKLTVELTSDRWGQRVLRASMTSDAD